MGLVVVLGEATRVEGFALGGATVIPAEDPDAVRRAWAALTDEVVVVVLTTKASAALKGEAVEHKGMLNVVMPP